MRFAPVTLLVNIVGFVCVGFALGWLAAIGLQCMVGALTANARADSPIIG